MSGKKIPGDEELFRRIAASARKTAQTEIANVLGPITRGGKVLWSALPYPKAGTTNVLPDGGHVGAVQPDGVTITLDPLTGIITSSGGGGLPTPVKGAIIRGNDTGSGPFWEIYGIDQGNQGDLLMNDRGGSGLPVWTNYASIVPVPPIQSGSGKGTKVLTLWTGGGNEPLSLHAGWDQSGFNDTGWPNAVASHENPGFPTFPATAVWASATPASDSEICIMRHHINVPSGAVNSATVILNVDDSLLSASFNGHPIAVNATPYTAGNQNFELPPSWFLPGDNVLAVQGQNYPARPNPPGGIGFAAICFNVSIN